MEDNQFIPRFAKLHGSIDTNSIIPPTWNKGVNKQEILSAWQLAYNSLIDANHLRIIGYSLPTTDTYIKYLLKSAVMKAQHLKSIDIICLDSDGSVKERYENFITFKYYRFANRNVIDYLQTNYKKYEKMGIKDPVTELPLDRLEDAHEEFFQSSSE